MFLAVILSHKEISIILAECSIPEAGGFNKSDRLYYAFLEKQRVDNCGNNIAAFIKHVFTIKLDNTRVRDKKRLEKLVISSKIRIFIGENQ